MAERTWTKEPWSDATPRHPLAWNDYARARACVNLLAPWPDLAECVVVGREEWEGMKGLESIARNTAHGDPEIAQTLRELSAARKRGE